MSKPISVKESKDVVPYVYNNFVTCVIQRWRRREREREREGNMEHTARPGGGGETPEGGGPPPML